MALQIVNMYILRTFQKLVSLSTAQKLLNNNFFRTKPFKKLYKNISNFAESKCNLNYVVLRHILGDFSNHKILNYQGTSGNFTCLWTPGGGRRGRS